MSQFSLREMAMIAISLDEKQEENRTKREKKKIYVHTMDRERTTEGEYRNIKQHLVDDEEKFYTYFHIPKCLF